MGDSADFKLNLSFIMTEVFAWKKSCSNRAIYSDVLKVVILTLQLKCVCELLS